MFKTPKPIKSLQLHAVRFDYEGETKIYVYYDGETYPYKEEIKKLGYKYGEIYDELHWYKETKTQSDLKSEVENAKYIGNEFNKDVKTFLDTSKFVHYSKKRYPEYNYKK